jgi:hypothetical protein
MLEILAARNRNLPFSSVFRWDRDGLAIIGAMGGLFDHGTDGPHIPAKRIGRDPPAIGPEGVVMKCVSVVCAHSASSNVSWHQQRRRNTKCGSGADSQHNFKHDTSQKILLDFTKPCPSSIYINQRFASID